MNWDADPALLEAHWQDQIEQAYRTGRRLRNMAVTVTIGHGVGTVVADGYGQLRQIEIDQASLRTINEEALGRKVVEAVNKVEAKAAAIRERVAKVGE